VPKHLAEQVTTSPGLGARIRESILRRTVSVAESELGMLVRFLAVGVLNTVAGLGTIYACKYFLSLGDIPSNMIGYLFGLTNSFFWNRHWTFAQSGDTGRTVCKFLLVFMLAYLFNLATILLLTRTLGVNSYLAHAIATIPYTAIFYLGSRYFVFPRGSAAIN
jgi:putative flippase GtrA